jgi:hypothetical protein
MRVDPALLKVFAGRVLEELATSEAKSVTKFFNDHYVMRATWRFKPRANFARHEIVLTVGAPNYAERKYRRRKTVGDKSWWYRAWPKKVKA